MGLDMYLTRKLYVQNWEHNPRETHHKIVVERGGKIRQDVRPEKITYIQEEVCSWRKFNALHNWFVTNVQEGEDNCKEYYVSYEQLDELLETLKEAAKNFEDEEKLEGVFPTQSGFFFGATDYDKWYREDVTETIEMLTELLSDEDSFNEWDYYYRASW